MLINYIKTSYFFQIEKLSAVLSQHDELFKKV